jgi:hypothetical protein
MQQINRIPYRTPKQGKDYFLAENFFDNALEIRERCLARTDWTLGFPHRNEFWPGKRCPNGLLPAEMEKLESWLKEQTGSKRLWQETVEGGGSLSHNYVQLVGEKESGARPHTDSRKLCRYAGVVYLNPDAPREGGTSFYRLQFPDGTKGGNCCPAPYANLREALGVAQMPVELWKEDLTIENVFNRVIVYRAEFVHSATQYFGDTDETKRLTIVFFWMAE